MSVLVALRRIVAMRCYGEDCHIEPCAVCVARRAIAVGITASDAAEVLGAIGGRAKSEIKAAAVRENGKKGGRPKGAKSLPR